VLQGQIIKIGSEENSWELLARVAQSGEEVYLKQSVYVLKQ
jgi:hypothetical protein